jgi:dCMP deaminase
MPEISERWDQHFLQLCLDHARMSKDPSTKVGAVIVGPDREIRSAGFNGFPRGIEDTHERLHNREIKYSLVVHGEMNAVLAAARVGTPIKGCTMYMAAMTGDRVWGSAPCTRCTVELIQAGISEIVSFSDAPSSNWEASVTEAACLLKEAGIGFRQIPYSGGFHGGFHG